ncbi:hypothetical protein PMIN01_11673 [Paraphaeosphaeria minitans]|uniref:Uncharacterized protein n=1 Tax=Paraphaeosphaeria minitans TaxID=565426 RepID=A0A9P6GAR5_9PLEO|nr:hypothetical protein PMIN01_11673 [Paraphaeosphaeria minitans]
MESRRKPFNRAVGMLLVDGGFIAAKTRPLACLFRSQNGKPTPCNFTIFSSVSTPPPCQGQRSSDVKCFLASGDHSGRLHGKPPREAAAVEKSGR